ncbi:MAG TPA: Xaa-Pro dipeptidase [Pseudomonadales bacterium]
MEKYAEHLEVLSERWQAALEQAGFDAAVVAAGAPREYFLDDLPVPFRPNPHFAQWFPDADCAHSALVIRPGERPRLLFYQPRDYWHQPPSVPEWAHAHFDVAVHTDLDGLNRAVAAALTSNRLAFVGEQPPDDVGAVTPNPPLLLNLLHYQRAYKTDFEIACMATANERAAAGHLAARAAFEAGLSEFHTQLRYLEAAGQTPEELPYHNIVAQNRHAGVLHYQHYERRPPEPLLSFLIDAGASHAGYAADVTRTYASPAAGAFAALVAGMDAAQRGLIERIRPGIDYTDVHEEAHRAVAALLAEHALVRCSAEAAFESGLTRTFLPHGVGHLIGLQTHDVGGHQASPDGGLRPPPEQYPALRLTRPVEARQVFTIEPGLYFIPMLLDELRQSPLAREVDWSRIEALSPCGGIRIEDNVVVTESGTRNLTREAFARAAELHG